jgi:biopolymer transport protein ExbB/TolQ
MVEFVITDFLTSILNTIAQSLLIPVIILLVIFIIIVLVEIGGLIAEYRKRKTMTQPEIDDLIFDISKSKDKGDVENLIKNVNLNNQYKDILLKIHDANDLDPNTKEAYSRKVIDAEEFKMAKRVRITDILTRVSSGCGLLGTLIPLGPGLASLGTGDIVSLSTQLIIAFNTTTVGLSTSLISYVISKIRNSWYEEDMSTVIAIAEALSEKKYD